MHICLFPSVELVISIEFDEEVLDPEVRVASPEDDHPPGLSLAEVLGGLGPMVLSARQQ